jgi:hypothetical protein
VRDNAIVIPIGALRRIFVGLLIVILLVVLVLVARTQLFRAGVSTLFAPGAGELIDRGGYQAVFLVGGQVFFGKLQEQGDRYFALTDVFYLSVSEQTGQQLVKRGTELHAPKDPLIIPAAEILFIENLRDDGSVATAIRQYKPGAAPVATVPPATPAPTVAPTARPSGVSPSPTR